MRGKKRAGKRKKAKEDIIDAPDSPTAKVSGTCRDNCPGDVKHVEESVSDIGENQVDGSNRDTTRIPVVPLFGKKAKCTTAKANQTAKMENKEIKEDLKSLETQPFTFENYSSSSQYSSKVVFTNPVETHSVDFESKDKDSEIIMKSLAEDQRDKSHGLESQEKNREFLVQKSVEKNKEDKFIESKAVKCSLNNVTDTIVEGTLRKKTNLVAEVLVDMDASLMDCSTNIEVSDDLYSVKKVKEKCYNEEKFENVPTTIGNRIKAVEKDEAKTCEFGCKEKDKETLPDESILCGATEAADERTTEDGCKIPACLLDGNNKKAAFPVCGHLCEPGDFATSPVCGSQADLLLGMCSEITDSQLCHLDQEEGMRQEENRRHDEILHHKGLGDMKKQKSTTEAALQNIIGELSAMNSLVVQYRRQLENVQKRQVQVFRGQQFNRC